MKYNKILDDVLVLVREAGKAVMKIYQTDFKVDTKIDDSPVTKADLESNRIIVAGLKNFGFAILSEEMTDDKTRLKEKRVWIVDPLDGTKDFIGRTDEFTIMIGLVADGKPVLGVIYAPAKNALYYAVKNGGAYKVEDGGEKKRINVSDISDLKNARLSTSRNHCTELERSFCKRKRIKETIAMGSSLKICEIAEGRAEINFNPAPKTWEWDVCASDIILSEAGGKLTDVRGKDIVYNKDNPRNERGYLGTNGVVHEKVVGFLNLKIK